MFDSETGEPGEAFGEITYLMERARADTRRVQAYRKAWGIWDAMSPAERTRRQRADDWTTVAGLGPKTAAVIRQSLAGAVPDTLAALRAEAQPLVEGGQELWDRLRGDLHMHTVWSDGAAEIADMVQVARRLGREFAAITDHSPRLRVANGLSPDRLRAQWQVIDDLNAGMDGFRVLRGSEVDILPSGELDLSLEVGWGLDVVVASVHSLLKMDSESMTVRMVRAIANPRTNILGHCTGRLVTGERGTRGESSFDAEVVFAACAQFGVAVEINGRPERRDPPQRLLQLAADMGCLFSIDSDAHAPGQQEFARYGCERAEIVGIESARIVNTWPVDRLVAWARAGAP